MQDTPKSSGFLKNSSSLDFDALNVALKDARLIDLRSHRAELTYQSKLRNKTTITNQRQADYICC